MLRAKAEAEKLNSEFELHGPESVIAWMLEKYGSRIAISSSFGPEDMVLIDMALKFDPKARIVTLDTGRLPEATYAVMDAVKFKYNCVIEVFFPDPVAVEKLTRAKGFFSFKESVENRQECCRIRKVEPLKRALGGLDAWITGQRRAQSVTRAEIKKIEIDEAHGNILKVNPLADWDEARVWDYIRKNKVPYSVLFDQGYRSVGCDPCTRAVKEGEDERAGRWWWENPEHKECGLHNRPGAR
ncbi:MAG: phosphoadenylyl-sulfate reductase [Candidatus Omnitrophica bacterium]|jgi:phosphoadenosine phosphosulfate reductase|nr:phosphoadenylyl-sulfate reductase [Candidatus Omnitrophota bacterium]